MKTLLLIRHAKSSWDNANLADFDRPLNDRGNKDAPKMAKRLISKKIMIDAFISSPAKRAKKTAQLFIKQYGKNEEEVILVSALYEASVNDFYQTINDVDDKYNSIAIFSHNPGITHFANALADKVRLDNMPTCSVFAVKAEIKKWNDFKEAGKNFWFFDYPKKED